MKTIAARGRGPTKAIGIAMVAALAAFGPFGTLGCESEPADATDTTAIPEVPETDTVEPDTEPDATGPASLCTTPASESWSFDDVAANGSYLAGYVDFTLTDPSRPTAAHGGLPEAASRTLSLRVWYPAVRGALGDLTPQLLAPLARADGPFPLVVHSHGFSSNKAELAYAGEWLATRGWVFAALEFPLSNISTLGGPQVVDVVNQPADVSFAIDELLGRNAVSSDALFGAIDPARIALSGVSLGGLTTLIATYHRDWHDPRVKAAVDFAGPTAFFSERFYSYVPLPTLLVYGDTDAIVDYAGHALPVRARAPAGSRLLTLHKASHTGFAGAAQLMETLDNPDSIGCSAIDGQLPDGANLVASLVDADIGIEDVPLPQICPERDLPIAMRPSRQHLLTRVALYAWLELQLGATSSARANACAFFESTFTSAADTTLE